MTEMLPSQQKHYNIISKQLQLSFTAFIGADISSDIQEFPKSGKRFPHPLRERRIDARDDVLMAREEFSEHVEMSEGVQDPP